MVFRVGPSSIGLLPFITLPCLRCPTRSALPVALPVFCLVRDPHAALLALCPALGSACAPPCPAARASLCPAARTPPCSAARAQPCPAASAPSCPAARAPPCPAARAPPCPSACVPPCPAAHAPPCPAVRALPCLAARTPCSPRAALPCSPRAALPCSPRASLPGCPHVLQPVRCPARAALISACCPALQPVRYPATTATTATTTAAATAVAPDALAPLLLSTTACHGHYHGRSSVWRRTAAAASARDSIAADASRVGYLARPSWWWRLWCWRYWTEATVSLPGDSLSPQQLHEWVIQRGRPSDGGYGAGGTGQQRQSPRQETLLPQQLREWVIQQGHPGGGGYGAGGIGQQRQQRQQKTLSPQQLREWVSQRRVPGSAEATSIGACEPRSSCTVSVDALHTFTLDSGATRYFFRDSTTVTLLTAPVPVSLADPSGGLVVDMPPLFSRVQQPPQAPSQVSNSPRSLRT
ncbi:unnamed protein product, partial [Closterium sp. NIES-53]